MKLLFPALITSKTEIGKSVEGRSVYSVKISDNPEVDEDEPEVLYTSLIHAREPESMMQMLYFMFYLLENYGTDTEVTYLVNNRELYFIPVINPDGYVYNETTTPKGGGMWRKNRKNNNGSYGVDLNRNFGPSLYWNAPNGGSSLNSSDETFRGTAPFSEPETESISNFLIERKIKNAWCPEGIITENPVLEYCKYIVFGKVDKMIIERKPEHGGNLEYSSFEELEKDFESKALHPMDLKSALIKYLDEFIEPVRKHFEKDANAKKLKEQVESFIVTR